MTGLYSPINRLMEQVTRPKGTGAEYMTELSKKPGYKPAEAEDRDLQALMALPQMQRAEFMEKLKGQANKFPLKQRELTGSQTHHGDYTLPGGENYREILLHTPDAKREELKKKLGEIGDLMASPGLPSDQYLKLHKTRAALADQYTHGTEGSFGGNAAHFGGTPNILASVRVKDRTSPEGKKVLHIEEIQSDWHQQGREHGYHPKDLYAQIRAAKAEKKMMDRYLKEADEDSGDMAYGEYGRMVDDHQAAIQKLDKLEQLKEEGVPYGPHAKDWHELALKAMIQHAAENGYDQIAVTPGAEQAKRFGLSKQVGSVSYHPETQHFQAFKPNRETITNEKGATPERVQALIGKEAAAKLMQAPQQMGHHYLEGEDLDMGGEGMKGFYDKMVPTFLNKFGKKHGVQVQPGAITVPEGIESGWATKVKPAYQAPVHTFDITPGMREDVVKNGIPRYAEGGDVSRETAEANKAKFLKGSKVPERVYHGTGNLENLQSFDPAMTGKGTDQLGSGFYFTTDPQEASGYASSFTQNQATKLGGGQAPGVVAAHLAIKKPLVVKGSNLSDTNVKLQHHHALALIKRAPNITHPDDSPLNDWVDTSRTGITPKVLHDVAKNYTGPSLMSLGNDFFRDDPTAFRTAIRDVLGYDGVMQDFGGGHKHYVAWFPHQIKSAIGNRGTYDPSNPDTAMAKGGSIKPVGHAVIKEKVTISPNMDAMQYELMGVKHFTKKAK